MVVGKADGRWRAHHARCGVCSCACAQVQAFLRDNPEVRALRERQSILQLNDFDLEFEVRPCLLS